MALYHSPRIVADGLVLSLDAANTKSYPGSGTTWTDLSGNGNNGTLTSGPTFSSNNNGNITLDGTDDYIDCGNNSSLTITEAITVSVWVRRTAYNSSAAMIIRRNSFDAYALQLGQSSPTVWWKLYFGASTWGQTATTSLELNEWANIVGTYDRATMRLYKNGVQAQTSSATSAIDNTGASVPNLIIGRDDPVTGRYFSGNIGIIQIYNICLNATQVLQNFQAFRGRYGI